MGFIETAMAITAEKKIRKGGKARLSISQIVNLLINLMAVKQNLSKEDGEAVLKLYEELRKDTQKHLLDGEAYLRLCEEIILQFNEIASFEQYSSGSVGLSRM